MAIEYRSLACRLFGFLWACTFAQLAAAGCSGPATAAGDPCAGREECDRQTFGELHVTTGATMDGFRSVVTGVIGSAEVLWSTSSEQTTFRYKPADGVQGPEVAIAGVPADTAGASRAAALLYGYDMASRGELAARAPGAAAWIAAARYTGPNGVENTAGCDQIHVFDCGTKGACCDEHDDCINEFCGGQGGSGNVLLALQAGYTDQPCSPACVQCHGAVVRCFFDNGEPGSSHCCDAGDCGQAQQCMIDGVVITDPCECEAAGVESSSQCFSECPPNACHETPPILDFPGCIPDGEPSLHACQCCGCVLLITNADGGGECSR
ncbi:MAG: hypothetical protein J5J06_15100 [Phycisphaerae bacterium]|nr:hypothetical protein [Phycisphaerae bacterium]